MKYGEENKRQSALKYNGFPGCVEGCASLLFSDLVFFLKNFPKSLVFVIFGTILVERERE
jgi:hypothetical protein